MPPKIAVISKRESRSFKKHQKSVDDINDNNDNKAERGASTRIGRGGKRQESRKGIAYDVAKKKEKERKGEKSRGETKAMINSMLDVQDH